MAIADKKHSGANQISLISICSLMRLCISGYFSKMFQMLVSGYDNPAFMLPMNLDMAVNINGETLKLTLASQAF